MLVNYICPQNMLDLTNFRQNQWHITDTRWVDIYLLVCFWSSNWRKNDPYTIAPQTDCSFANTATLGSIFFYINIFWLFYSSAGQGTEAKSISIFLYQETFSTSTSIFSINDAFQIMNCGSRAIVNTYWESSNIYTIFCIQSEQL